MSRHIISANDLASGRVVFRTASGGWSENPLDAAAFAMTAAETELARAQADATLIVGPYLVPIDEDGAPQSRRERIRALGPTVRSDLGKQAAGGR